VTTEIAQRNVDLVAAFAAIYEEGGLDGQIDRFDEFCDPDYELVLTTGLGEERFTGKDGVRAYRDNLFEHFTEARLGFPAEIRAVGEDRVLVLGDMRLVGRESGVPMEEGYGIVFTVGYQRLLSGYVYSSREEAEEAVAGT
jgi:ketosteroid isomerase-like protein